MKKVKSLEFNAITFFYGDYTVMFLSVTFLGLVEECDPVIFCLKFGNYLQFTFEMIKDRKALQINLGLGLKLGLGLELRVRVRVKVRS